MPERIPQSTAIRVPLLAYLTGTTTPATGQTITITISKNGGAFANPSGGATNATEIANGAYYVDLTTPDTGTLGPLIVLGTASGVDSVFAIYDIALATNGGWTGVPNIAAGAVGGLPLSFDSAGGVNVAQDVTVGGYASGQDPATLVLDASASAHDTAGTIGAQINAAATVADPWAVDLPGPYVSPQAGAILPALVRTVVTYTGPIDPTTGDVTLICGDDYYSADGRALTFGVPTGGGNPDLTGATVTANWYLAAQTNPVASVNGTVSSPGTINQAVTYQIPSDTTDLLIASRYILVLQAVLSDASIVTFARLNCTVISPPNGTIST